MSPEQCRGEPLDWRTDLYCLGLLGWFLLAGDYPYSAENLGKVLDEQMNRPLPPLESKRPELSPAVYRTLLAFCAKRRVDRPGSMEEAIALLESLRPRYLDLAPIALRATAALLDLLLLLMLLGAFVALSDRVLGLGLSDTVWEGVVASALLALSQLGVEAWTGRSLGKYVFNLSVVSRDGRRPRFTVTLARFLCRFPAVLLPVLPGFAPKGVLMSAQVLAIAAGLVCYLVFRRRTLSDLVTRTRVVYRGPPGSRERTA